MGKRRKRSLKKAQENLPVEDEELKKAPHTFVFQRGHVGKNLQQLTMDMRKVMEPFTASKLKVRKKNVLKDFVSIAGPIGVSHLMMFSKSTCGNNLRLVCLPHGPTLTFQIEKYSLCRDVIESLRRPQTFEGQYRHAPLLVLNNFNPTDAHKEENDDGFNIQPHKLTSKILQNMFPSININKIHLNHVKRCALFNYDTQTNSVEFRHYNIAVKPVGVSRKMKKLISRKKIPHLGRYTDISEFLLQQGDGSASESEPELETNQVKVDLPQDVSGKGNIVNEQSAIRLTELGPRFTMNLLKIEEGMCDGAVIFHRNITKTPAELVEMEKMRGEKQKLKNNRKQEQEKNVKRKIQEKEDNKNKSLAGMKRKADLIEKRQALEVDNREWYKKEVGEEPPKDIFHKPDRNNKKFKRKRSSMNE